MYQQDPLTTVDLVTLLPAFRTYNIQDVPDGLALAHIITGAREFMVRSGCYTYEYLTDFVGGLRRYDLDIPTGFEVGHVKTPAYPTNDAGDTPRFPYRVVSATPTSMTISGAPSTTITNGIVLRATLVPVTGGCLVPTDTFNKYNNAFIRYALWQLLSMPKEKWSSSQMAKTHYLQYNILVSRARGEADTTATNGLMAISRGYF
jgi:hypothetical protein